MRKARDLVSYFVGQGVGLIDSVKSAGAVVQEFKEDFVEAVEHMNALVDGVAVAPHGEEARQRRLEPMEARRGLILRDAR